MNATLTPPARGARPTGPDLRLRMIDPLCDLLRQLADVVHRLDDAAYTRKPVGVVESSVGGHVRHCLDHVAALLAAADTGHLDYDRRDRGTPVESSAACAAGHIAHLVSRLQRIPAHVLTRPLSVSVTMTADGPPITVLSSVGREVAYVLSHTIHHNALIGAMVRTLGGWLPERFGYAPTTVKHLRTAEAAECVR